MHLALGCLFIVSTCSTIHLTSSEGLNGSTEKKLIRDLLGRYELEGKVGRPVVNPTDTILVNFSLSLVQILDVDEKNQVLTTNIWYHYKWCDILLQWDPVGRDNITSIRVSSEKIWLPDVRLYNFADDRLTEKREALVVVKYTGELLWKPQAILNSSCTFQILYFPFDHQTCYLKFGSWTYNGNMLNIDFMDGEQEMDLSHHIQSNEWDVVGNLGQRNVKYYTCCPEPFPDLTFTLRLKRKIAFYTIILILPCGLLSSLTLVIFWVPPENPAKLQLGMNIFLAFFVQLLVLADLTPTSAAATPLIGGFYCLSMVMIALSTVLACVVANMHFRGVRINRAPMWLRSCLIDNASKTGNVRQAPVTTRKIWSSYVTNVRSQSDPDKLVAQVLLLDHHNLDRSGIQGYGTFQDITKHGDKLEPSTSTANPSSLRSSTTTTTTSDTTSQDTILVDEVGFIRELLDEELVWRKRQEESDEYILEWRMIACVMDRIFFFFYVVVNLLGLTSIFLRSYLS